MRKHLIVGNVDPYPDLWGLIAVIGITLVVTITGLAFWLSGIVISIN